MAKPAARGAVLIVVMGREDRRALFETLDTHEFDAIYTAKDFAQAHAFLRQEPRLDVVLLEFAGEAHEALAFCAALREEPRTRDLPVIGIADDAGLRDRWGWGREPREVVDWLRSPVLGDEALARIERATRDREAARRGAAPAATDGGDATSASGALAAPDAPAPSAPPPPDYRFAFEGSLDELVLSDPATGLIVEVNGRFEELSGLKREQLAGTTVEGLDLNLGPAERQAVRARLKRDGIVRFRSLRAAADGSRRWTEATYRLVRRGNETLCLASYRPPPTVQTNHAAIATAAAILRTRGAETIADIAQLLERALQVPHVWVVRRPGELEEEPTLVHVRGGGADVAPNWSELLRRVEGGGPLVLREGAATALADDPAWGKLGIEALLALPLLDERQGQIGLLVAARLEAMAEDAAALALVEIAAARIALALELDVAREQGRAKGLQDSLTGLPNRLLYNDRLETTIKEAHRTGEMFAVLFVDLDRFKTINDSLGHGIGDEVLIATAKRLRASVRGSDTVARYAGDEFTLILRHIVQRDDVLRIAEKICRVLEAPLTLSDSRELHITASIGVSFYPDDATTSEKLLQHADVAMYSAKGMGRNTFQTYVAVPEESHQQRLALEAKLRQAERNGELRVYYQPQVEAANEDICGMEALIRWEHPELGMISPGFFIPLAEETGLIVSIGEWVLRQACADTRRFHERFGLPLRVGVNLSALQLRQPNLVDVVKSALADTGLAAQYLELEVTESISVKSIPNLMEGLQALRDLGCKIAIDDFGTGQSSLDYIRRFPADRIKIDQVFVRNIGVDPDDEAIVRATIDMAHNLNRSVVAEGVEYEEHLAFLRDHGCEELQGYLFCRPLPVASFENLLAERARLLEAAAG